MNHGVWWVAGLLTLPACNGKDDTADTSDGLDGPSMVHVEFEDSFSSGAEITFAVEADDDDGVGGVSIFFRTAGADYWNNRPMAGQVGVEEWTVALSGEEVGAPGLEYYFRGEDLGPVKASSYLPLAGADDPFSLTVVDAGLPLPFVEDFEADSLFSLGWVNVWHEFGGYPWRITDVGGAPGGLGGGGGNGRLAVDASLGLFGNRRGPGGMAGVRNVDLGSHCVLVDQHRGSGPGRG